MNDYLHKPLHFCVLIPCYNDEAGLVQALKTVYYPFNHCLAVIVDDGSARPIEAQYIAAQVATGLPVQVIRLSKNKGITTALNAGLDWIVTHTQAPYIARLDCRDRCHPQRFQQQVTFLNSHPQVGLLGSWCRFEEEGTGISYNYTTPVAHKEIKKAMPMRNVFIHPTVMFRSGPVKQGEKYPEDFPHAEDYGFCWRLLQLAEGAILPQYLVTCAITRSGISYRNRRQQLQSRKKVIKKYAPKTWINKKALIKINLLMLVPKTLVLRLKGLKNKVSRKLEG